MPAVDVKVHYEPASTFETSTTDGKHGTEKESVTSQHADGTPEYVTPPPTTSENKPPTSATLNEKMQKIDPLIPGIDITTPSHFSKKEPKRFVMPDVGKTNTSRNKQKRPCLYAWVALQSLPEMVISPYLLDFVEQTLAAIASPIALSHSFAQKRSTSSQPGSLLDSFAYSEDEGTEESEANDAINPDDSVFSSESPLVSLPLDVVVFIKIQPSQVCAL